jgi:hypothetical protein
MPISNSYPRGIPIEDADLFVGTKAYNNRTVNYTAQGVADYLNINSKVAIGGQMSFQFTIVPNIPKTIAFEGGLGNNTAFSAITKLIVSAIDVSTANITIFLNYLNNSQVLLSEQNQPNSFGHYKITGYTQIGTSAFYELDLEFIGGNGTIIDKQYYDLVSFVLSTGATTTEWGSITGDIEDQTDLINYISSQITTPTLQEVTDEGNTITTTSSITTLGEDAVSVFDVNLPEFGASIGAYGLFVNGDTNQTSYQYNKIIYVDEGTSKNLQINYPASIVGTNKVQTFQDADGTIALLSDIPSGGVTSVTATSPITSSGGTTPVISTSMATNKLIGRSTAGTGVMEEITVGTGLSLSGGTLNATAQTVGFEQNFLLMGS